MYTSFPFAEIDINKFMAGFKVPGFEYEALLEAQSRNLAALQETGTAVGANVSEIAQRQVEMFQKGVEDALSGAREVAQAATPEDGAKRQLSLAQQAVALQVENLKELGGLYQKAGSEVFGLFNSRLAEGLDAWRQATTEAPQAKPGKTKPK